MASGLFEEFKQIDPAPPSDEAHDEELEDERLRAFEQGYGAGWEDAIRAQEEAGRRLLETLETSVSESLVTRDDAMREFLQAARPLFEAMTETILPSLAHRSFGSKILEVLENALSDACNTPVEVAVSKDQLSAVQAALADTEIQELIVRAEPSLGSGQARLKLGASEKQIDVPEVIAEIRDLQDAFIHAVNKEARHG